jgi:ribosomal protein L16 Arg81 hydroxylase
MSKQTFFEEYWEKRPLVVNRNQPEYFSSLLSLDEIDHVSGRTVVRSGLRMMPTFPPSLLSLSGRTMALGGLR